MSFSLCGLAFGAYLLWLIFCDVVYEVFSITQLQAMREVGEQPIQGRSGVSIKTDCQASKETLLLLLYWFCLTPSFGADIAQIA